MKLNTLNAELNPVCHLLALLKAHPILHVRRIRVKENNNVESGAKMEEEILDRKNCRRIQLDLEELGTGKEAELCIVLNDSSATHTY
jgi:hypothetical protein